MGKVKSAIITALLVAAILTLALFATISCNLPGGVERYNSFVSKISLGGDLTGYATTVLYPEGVRSDADYNGVVGDTEENNSKKREDYLNKYVQKGSLWVDKEKLGDDDGKAFAESVQKDAKIISDRLSRKGYTGYSVTVSDGYAVKISVPAGFSYAVMKNYDNTERNAALSAIGHTISYLSLGGELSLRNSSTYEGSASVLLTIGEKLGDYVKSASVHSLGGNHALKIELTDEGLARINAALTKEGASGSAYIFIGETGLGLTFTMGTALTEKTLYFQADKGYSEDYAIAIDSVAKGQLITNKYNDAKSGSISSLAASTPEFGKNAAIWLGAAVLVIIAAAIIYSIIRYRLLGIVNSIMIAAYSVALATAMLLTGVQVTIAGVLNAILGLAVLCASNFYVFENVRYETTVGRTIQSSVKLGYKKSLFGVLDVHIVLIIASAIMALVGVGELAACGLIFLIGVLASYVLHWLTRFMWYVLSSPVRNKFRFCGFERKVEDDE